MKETRRTICEFFNRQHIKFFCCVLKYSWGCLFFPGHYKNPGIKVTLKIP